MIERFAFGTAPSALIFNNDLVRPSGHRGLTMSEGAE
jgi:hypothetical protein